MSNLNTNNAITDNARGTSAEQRGFKKPIRATKKTIGKKGKKNKRKDRVDDQEQQETLNGDTSEQEQVQEQVEQDGIEQASSKRSEKYRKIASKVEEVIQQLFGQLITRNKHLSLLNEDIVKIYASDDAFDLALVEYSQTVSDHVFDNYELYQDTFPDFTEGTTNEKLAVAAIVYKNLKEGSPPAFTDKLTPKIHLRYIDATMLCHEAFHLYSAEEFRALLGKEIDEGMTHYLTDLVMKNIMSWYQREGWQEGVDYIGLQQDYYKKEHDYIKDLINIGGIEMKQDLINAFFTGVGVKALQNKIERF